MNPIPRRTFLQSGVLAAGAGLLTRVAHSSVWAQPEGANGAVRIAIIGLNSKGASHLKNLLTMRDVRIAALCDVDPAVLARVAARAKEQHVEPFTTTDARQVLARPDVDAVLIATGDYWHALLTVWACQAGKDVYVEKPMGHTIWEGRKMIQAAAKYGRIVQVGLQYTSDPGLLEAGEYVRAGQLGKIKHVRALYYGRRGAVARRLPWYPSGLDYDLYCGPSPAGPIERDKLHYDWLWMWATGGGDLAGNGVHLFSAALRMVGHAAPPLRVLSLGGRFVVDDVAQTPNTMLTVYDYPEIPIVYEQRNLPVKPGVNYMDQFRGVRVGIVVECEGGSVAGLVGATAFDRDGKLIRKFVGSGGVMAHLRTFIAAVKSRRGQDLAAHTEYGHAVAAMCYYGNISYRIGMQESPHRIEQALGGSAVARNIFAEMQNHLAAHQIDLERQPLTLGRWLQTDWASDGIASVESDTAADLEKARFLLRETQRPPYVIPEQI